MTRSLDLLYMQNVEMERFPTEASVDVDSYYRDSASCCLVEVFNLFSTVKTLHLVDMSFCGEPVTDEGIEGL